MTAKIIPFPGPRRFGRTAQLHKAMLDWMRHSAGKKVALISRNATEVWRDGQLIEVVPHEKPVSEHNRSDAVFAAKITDLVDSETIQFPPHESRVGTPWWETVIWPTPPKEPK